jgi:hypothetical protein
MAEVDTKWSVRVQRIAAGARAYAGKSAFDVGSQASLRDSDPLPSSVEYALGALGGDLICGFEREAAARRIAITGIEMTLSGRLNNVLVHLGVIGETGHAGFESINGVVYIGSGAEETAIRDAWHAALHRSPLFNTFSRAAEIALSLRVVE